MRSRWLRLHQEPTTKFPNHNGRQLPSRGWLTHTSELAAALGAATALTYMPGRHPIPDPCRHPRYIQTGTSP